MRKLSKTQAQSLRWKFEQLLIDGESGNGYVMFKDILELLDKESEVKDDHIKKEKQNPVIKQVIKYVTKRPSKYRSTFIVRNKRKILTGHTDEEWERLKARFNYRCVCCYRREPLIKLTKDHILPISQGGRDSIKNIQPLCKDCNHKKSNQNINYIKYLQYSMVWKDINEIG